MAYTFAVSGKSVYGNQRVVYGTVTADAAAGNVNTGLLAVERVTMTPKSLTTGAIKLRVNVLETATASAGYVAFSGCTSGDEMFIAVYGR